MWILLAIIVIELFFCAFEYVHAKAVFVNPTFLSMIVITISTVLGAIGNSYWNVQISAQLILVFFLGFTSMITADFLARITTKGYRYSKVNEIFEVGISNKTTNIVLTIVVLCTIFYCVDILRAGAAMGYRGWSAIHAVKRNNSGTSVIIRQGVKVVMASMFIHTFIFTNNVLLLKRKGFKNFKHIIPAICAILCCVFTSVRTEIFRVLTALMVFLCVLLFQQRRWNMTSLRKFVKRIIPYVAIGVALLVGVRFIVKGTENATSNTYGLFMYAAYYLGTPTVVLGSKLTEGITSFQGTLFGETTFNQFYSFLQEHGSFSNITLQDGSRNVWIDQANRITANVDTIFGPPTIDFGILGMFIYIFIVYYFLNRYYYKYIYKTQASSKRNVKLITYSFFAAIPAMAYYTNYLNQFLTVYFVLTFIMIKIIERYYGMTPPWIKTSSRKVESKKY